MGYIWTALFHIRMYNSLKASPPVGSIGCCDDHDHDHDYNNYLHYYKVSLRTIAIAMPEDRPKDPNEINAKETREIFDTIVLNR
jgi:hypothetical protein